MKNATERESPAKYFQPKSTARRKAKSSSKPPCYDDDSYYGQDSFMKNFPEHESPAKYFKPKSTAKNESYFKAKSSSKQKFQMESFAPESESHVQYHPSKPPPIKNLKEPETNTNFEDDFTEYSSFKTNERKSKKVTFQAYKRSSISSYEEDDVTSQSCETYWSKTWKQVKAPEKDVVKACKNRIGEVKYKSELNKRLLEKFMREDARYVKKKIQVQKSQNEFQADRSAASTLYE